MFILNKIVGFMINPMSVGLLLILAAAVFLWRRNRRLALSCCLLAFLWFWVWSSKPMYLFLGGGLEKRFPPMRAEAMPKADAIVLLGGGMTSSRASPYAEMWSAADRVWHAARLYRAGKAPVVVPTGVGEESSSVPLLVDFGVPSRAIRAETASRNTEENAQYTARLIKGLPGAPTNGVSKVLLVTSAWHMRRALLVFARQGVEVIPAATDHEFYALAERRSLADLVLPNPAYLARNGDMFKEYVGYWLYCLRFTLFNK